MATEEEAAILAKYSTPGLRKGEFSRQAKRLHLAGQKMSDQGIEAMLAAIYDVDGVSPVQAYLDHLK